MDIALQTRAGLYDCLYVALAEREGCKLVTTDLAEREGCKLVTTDQRAIHNLSPHFPFIVPLASLP